MIRPLALLTVLAAPPLLAQGPTAAGTTTRVAVELALRQTGSVDETLSRLRYRGNAFALHGDVRIPRGRAALVLDADLAVATLGADVGLAQRPEVEWVATELDLGVELRGRRLGAFLVAPTIALAGRLAGREHHFTSSQSGNRFEGQTQPSHDEVVALRPGVIVAHTSASGQALALTIATSVLGAARHPYFPGGLESDAHWIAGGPGQVLLAKGALGWTHRASRRVTLGIRYSAQLVRIAGESAVGEASQQLGVTCAWGGR